MSKITKPKTRKEQLEDKLSKFASLQALANQPGGKILLEASLKDAMRSVSKIIRNYRTLTLQEFIAEAASLESKIDMVNILKNSTAKRDLAKDELAAYIATAQE